MMADSVYAQELPAAVDSGRIQNEQAARQKEQERRTKPKVKLTQKIKPEAPKEADDIFFVLNSVTFEGMNVFDKAQFAPLYQNKTGQSVPASLLWEIATAITKHYRDKGYFLSRALVPAQAIKTGDVRIMVIEGYIASIDITEEIETDRLVQTILSDILSQQPANIQHLESQLLKLNALYNVDFSATLAQPDFAREGAVTLKLERSELSSSRVRLSTNNYGSRFNGPYRTTFTVSHSFFDYQQTAISAQTSSPNSEELALGSLSHNIQITPSSEIDFRISDVKSEPGHTLKVRNIKSESFSGGLGIRWQPIYQRDESLTLSARLDSLDNKSTIFNQLFSQDKVRALRLETNYEFIDPLQGVNFISLTASHGLKIMNASKQGDSNISRADASPDFAKLEAYYNRRDFFGADFALTTSLSGQWASRSLFSSEEFGYGGARFGRAYDSYEISGDHGITASLELTYSGLNSIYNNRINPFLFYDIGKVWNEGLDSANTMSAASAGGGIRVYNDSGVYFNTLLAFPTTKPIETPIQSSDNTRPVLRFEFSYNFDIGLF